MGRGYHESQLLRSGGLPAHHEKALVEALDEGGVSRSRTRVGWDVVTRHGDPTSIHGLVRVSAQSAASVLLMLSRMDATDEEASRGKIQNAATTRALLALRHCLFAGGRSQHPALRVTVQLSAPSEYVDAAAFVSPRGERVVQALDLSLYINSLMFTCASIPGLSRVLLSLADFERTAMRARDAHQLRGGPRGEPGGLVGMTCGEALRASWANAVFVGLAGHIGEGGGLAPDPARVIEASDRVIFISESSNPTPLAPACAERLAAAAAAIAPAALPAFSLEARLDEPSVSRTVLVCGFRDKVLAATSACSPPRGASLSE